MRRLPRHSWGRGSAPRLPAGVRIALAAVLLVAGPPGAWAASPDECGVAGGVLAHGPRGSGRIALSFDACPTRHVPGFDAAIVDYLERERVPATFFLSGAWAARHPEAVARLAAVPFFELGSHGSRHRHLRPASPATTRAEIAEGLATLRRLGVEAAPLFRPPYGDRPGDLGELAREAGVVPVLWDVVSGDPAPGARPAVVERAVLRGARGGSIVVMHVNGRAPGTARALPGVVEGLRARGYTFVTVGELARSCGLAAPGTAR